MEAAEPIEPETKEPNFETKKIDFIEDLLIKKENEEYRIQFGKIKNLNELVIKVSQENFKDLYYYKKNYTIHEFQNLSLIFSKFKTVEDIIKFLKNRKFTIELINDLLIIKFNVYLHDGKNELIELVCKKHFQDINQIVNYILEKNKSFNNDIKEYKEKLKEISDSNEKYKTEISNLKENIHNYKEEIKEELSKSIEKRVISIILTVSFSFINIVLVFLLFYLNQSKILNLKYENKKELGRLKLKTTNLEYTFKMDFDSKIFQSINKIEFILDHILKNDESFIFNKIKLLYRGSRDGDRTKTCHELCDNKQNVLIIIQSDKGYIFGGYSKIGFKTTKNWENKIDNNSFLFSIDLKKKYPVIKDTDALVYKDDNWGLCFFVSLYFKDNFMNRNDNFIGVYIKEHFIELKDKYEMNGGEKHFKIKELEVFQLL